MEILNFLRGLKQDDLPIGILKFKYKDSFNIEHEDSILLNKAKQIDELAKLGCYDFKLINIIY